MRNDETSTDAPLTSPKEPPVTNYAVVRSFPLSVSLTRGPLSSVAAAEAGAQRGPRRCLGRASVARGPPFPRASPTVAVICFLILFCFIISQICVDIEKYEFPSI